MNEKYTRYKPRPGSAYATYSHQKQPRKHAQASMEHNLIWFRLSGHYSSLAYF